MLTVQATNLAQLNAGKAESRLILRDVTARHLQVVALV